MLLVATCALPYKPPSEPSAFSLPFFTGEINLIQSERENMAIYHFHTKMITRSTKGTAAKAAGARGSTAQDERINVRSVVAAAAYQSGQSLALQWDNNPFARLLLAMDTDRLDATQEEAKALTAIPSAKETRFDYTRKQHVDFAEIFAPVDAPDWVHNRETLWNRAENAETRIDSQLACSIDAALPCELSLEQCKALVAEFVRENYTSRGMVADVAIHDMQGHNPHLHILLTTREVDGEEFAAKKCAAWKPSFSKKSGLKLMNSPLQGERESWEACCNRALQEAGEAARIDHRSYEKQGIDRQPTFHMGKNATHSERRGNLTEIGSRLRDIVSFNKLRESLKAWQEKMAAEPFYKLSFLQRAREAWEQHFHPDLLPLERQAHEHKQERGFSR